MIIHKHSLFRICLCPRRVTYTLLYRYLGGVFIYTKCITVKLDTNRFCLYLEVDNFDDVLTKWQQFGSRTRFSIKSIKIIHVALGVFIMSTIMLFFVACSARPFASDFFAGPINMEEEEEIIVSTESGVESEAQENTNVSTPSSGGGSLEEERVALEDQELRLVTESTCLSPCSFSVNNSIHAVRVVYKADSWEIAESQDADTNFSITYDFEQDGERNIQAYSYDFLGNLIDSDKKIVQVEMEIEEEDAVDVSLPQVPYFYQFNNTQSPNSTCANTSVAMVLSYYGWSDTPDVLTNYYGVSTAQSPTGLASVFNSEASYFNMSQRLIPITDGTIVELKNELDTGRPVIVHGYFTNAGHVIVVLGYDEHGYWVNDPAGTWDQQFRGGYPYGWEPTAGNVVYYNKFNFELAISSIYGNDYAPVWMHFVR